TKFYQATPSNIASIFAVNTSYGSDPLGGDTRTLINSFMSTGSFNAVVPSNARVGQWGSFTIEWGPVLAYSNDGTQLGYDTTAGYKGGGSSVDYTDPMFAALSTTQNVKPQKPLK